MVSGLDFFILNFSATESIFIDIACATGCVDFNSYTIEPKEKFYFTVDSLCNHSFCGLEII
ncbi:MAG: hypothetical protein EA409_06840 [Saprospirales bacterium]|nr:MAG: hypothetical protein EA409_06840 [Saprospirales bacterium]